MKEAGCIHQALGPLLSHGRVSMTAIAIAGDVITIDAGLLDYGGIAHPTRRTTHDELGLFLETYDNLLQRTQSAIADFFSDGDQSALMYILLQIKEELAALRPSM
jgi:hypothetical protein